MYAEPSEPELADAMSSIAASLGGDEKSASDTDGAIVEAAEDANPAVDVAVVVEYKVEGADAGLNWAGENSEAKSMATRSVDEALILPAPAVALVPRVRKYSGADCSCCCD